MQLIGLVEVAEISQKTREWALPVVPEDLGNIGWNLGKSFVVGGDVA